MPFFFLNNLFHFRNDRLLFQRKYFCRLCDDFDIEVVVIKTQIRTTNRKKQLAILLVGEGGCFRDSKK